MLVWFVFSGYRLFGFVYFGEAGVNLLVEVWLWFCGLLLCFVSLWLFDLLFGHVSVLVYTYSVCVFCVLVCCLVCWFVGLLLCVCRLLLVSLVAVDAGGCCHGCC